MSTLRPVRRARRWAAHAYPLSTAYLCVVALLVLILMVVEHA